MKWLILLFPILASAQTVQEPLRETTPEYVSFYLKRLDKWFEANVEDFKMPENERTLFNEMLASQKALVVDGYRTVTYSVKFDLRSTGAKSVTILAPQALNAKIVAVAKAHGIKVPKEAKAMGLRWGDSFALVVVNDKMRFITKDGEETLEPTKDGNGCPGVFQDGPTELFTDRAGAKHYRYSSDQIETAAMGPGARDLDRKFRQGLNLSPGQVSCSPGEFFYP